MPRDDLSSFRPVPAGGNHGLTLRVRLPDGGEIEPTVSAGSRVIDVLEAQGLALRGDCHVRVLETWCTRLPQPEEEERTLLGGLSDAGVFSRLARNIVMTPALDGLEIELHPDGLIPQTYWIAG